MQRHTLYLLLLGLTFAIGIAWLLTDRPGPEPSTVLRLGGLQKAQIERLTISNRGHTVVRLVRRNNRWFDASDGYAADNARIDAVLARIFSARILEPKTAREDQYARIGVQATGSPDARGIVVQLSSGAAESQTIIFGDVASNGQYLRLSGAKQAWLVAPAIELPVDRIEWLDRDILNIPAAQLIKVRIMHTDGDELELVRKHPENAGFTLLNIPADKQLLTPEAPNRIAGILSELRLESVRSAVAFDTDTPVVMGEFHTRDGTVISSRGFTTKDGMAFSFHLSNHDNADQMAPQLDQWVYTLPTFKQQQFLTRPDDLLQ